MAAPHTLPVNQTRRSKIAPACRTYRLIACGLIWMCKKCVLPNHIHAIWTLPPDDADYSLRWRLIKTKFSAHFPRAENLSAGKQRRNERGIWQRRFYEHTVRDETDLQRCTDYIHFNPVKHGLCGNIRDWAFSSFHRYVRDGWLPLDWGRTKETAVMSFGE